MPLPRGTKERTLKVQPRHDDVFDRGDRGGQLLQFLSLCASSCDRASATRSSLPYRPSRRNLAINCSGPLHKQIARCRACECRSVPAQQPPAAFDPLRNVAGSRSAGPTATILPSRTPPKKRPLLSPVPRLLRWRLAYHPCQLLWANLGKRLGKRRNISPIPPGHRPCLSDRAPV